MSKSVVTLNLATLARGAAMERFDVALATVVENILDPNTPEGATREINLKVRFKPTPGREAALLEISCVPKVAPLTPYPLTVYLGKNDEGGFASEADPRQGDMFSLTNNQEKSSDVG